MKNVDSYFRAIENRQKRSTVIVVVALVAAAAFCLYNTYSSYSFARSQREQIYILDQGKSLIALQSDGAATKELETIDHVRQFHEFFFNLAPSREAIEENVDKALLLADKSAYAYWNTLSEQGFYNKLISGNVSQQMVVDSVKVNTSVYPYEAKTYAHYYQVRQSNISLLRFESSCKVISVSRSTSNPHGLMIENFVIDVNEEISVRNR